MTPTEKLAEEIRERIKYCVSSEIPTVLAKEIQRMVLEARINTYASASYLSRDKIADRLEELRSERDLI